MSNPIPILKEYLETSRGMFQFKGPFPNNVHFRDPKSGVSVRFSSIRTKWPTYVNLSFPAIKEKNFVTCFAGNVFDLEDFKYMMFLVVDSLEIIVPEKPTRKIDF